MANEVRTFTLNDDPGQVIEDLNAAFDGTTQTGLKADSANIAANVTTNINGHAIADIFESDGVTVKKATHATSADSATTAASCIGNSVTASNLSNYTFSFLHGGSQVLYPITIANGATYSETLDSDNTQVYFIPMVWSKDAGYTLTHGKGSSNFCYWLENVTASNGTISCLLKIYNNTGASRKVQYRAVKIESRFFL